MRTWKLAPTMPEAVKALLRVARAWSAYGVRAAADHGQARLDLTRRTAPRPRGQSTATDDRLAIRRSHAPAGRIDRALLSGVPLSRPIRLDGYQREALEIGRTRLVVAAIAFGFLFLATAVRLIDVTLFQDGGDSRAEAVAAATPARADIVDRNGTLLATSLDSASIYANPKRIIDAEDAARKLASVLTGLDRARLQKQLGSERSFIWVRRNITPRQQFLVNRLGIPGIYFLDEKRRVYPQGALTGHIVGYTDIDNTGLAGLERSFNAALTDLHEPLETTLDVRVQHVVREELGQAMRQFSAIGAVGLVLDVSSGAVAGMVSLPDFDPNEPGDSPPDARFNRATLGLYEMGSTLKIFTTAMALDANVTSLAGGYDASHPLRFGRFTIHDYKGKNRWLSVPEIFKYSSNIGMAKMALDVGTERQQGFLDAVGLMRPSSIELEEVGAPLLPDPWREINTVTIAYGHGIAVSPLQTASAVAAIVNGGVYHKPTLIRPPAGVRPIGQRVIRPEVAQSMRKLLRLVVTEGTGRQADADGYIVGGKTGSAEKQKSGGYSETALVSSFVGAFPMNDPRYVVFAMLDEPKGRPETQGYATGGWVAAPIVARIVRRVAPLLGVPPQDPRAPDIAAALSLPSSTASEAAGESEEPIIRTPGADAGSNGRPSVAAQ